MVTGDSAQNQDVLNTIDAIKLKGSGFPEIFSAPWRRNYASDPQKFWRCKNMLEVFYHRAKFRGARISPAAGAAKNVEFLTGSIARSATRQYLRYSEADFEVFHHAGATRCTDGGEIWHVPSSMPSFTPIGAACRPCVVKNLKIGL